MKRALMTGAAALALTLAASGCQAQKFANCTEVHKVHKGGIAKPGYHQVGMVTRYAPFVDLAAYNANSGLDRDHDGVACEA